MATLGLLGSAAVACDNEMRTVSRGDWLPSVSTTVLSSSKADWRMGVVNTPDTFINSLQSLSGHVIPYGEFIHFDWTLLGVLPARSLPLLPECNFETHSGPHAFARAPSEIGRVSLGPGWGVPQPFHHPERARRRDPRTLR